jgi:hypothetical protein
LPLIGNYSLILAWLIPISEMLISVLFFIPKSRTISFYLSFFIMLLFTAYISYMLIYVSDLPCNCGGITKYMSWGQQLVFNIGLVLLALWGILTSKNIQKEQSQGQRES